VRNKERYGRIRSMSKNALDFWISRDAATATDLPSFQSVNVSSLNMTSSNQLATFTLTLTQLEQSVFVNIKPKDSSVSYLLVLKFGKVPVVTSFSILYDSFKFLCRNKGTLSHR
jgi:hypothetical protein